MNIKDKVKLLLKEASLYKSQRLLKESKGKYLEAIKLIQNEKKIQNKEVLINTINSKISALDKSIVQWDKSETTPEVSAKVQNLIQKLFTTESAEDSVALRALKNAITLAKFGQYQRAIDEFDKLVGIEEVSVAAAKNAVKCIMEIASIQEAAAQYRKWVSNGVLPGDREKTAIGNFLHRLADKLGVDLSVDPGSPAETESESSDLFAQITGIEDDEDDIIDITSIGIRFTHGPKKGDQVELEVSFQAGNMLSLIVSDKDKMLVDALTVGVKLDDVDFYSPIAIFKGSGIVEANTQIQSGPKKGNYSLDIKIYSI